MGDRRSLARPANPIPPAPLEVGIIGGDAINSLRSALNYLVWQLALAKGTRHPQLQFPIVHDYGDRAFKTPAPARFHAVAKTFHLELVGKDNLALIERMQPYRGERWRPLAFLADLNDVDKHRVIATHTAAVLVNLPKFYGVGRGTMVRLYPELHEGAKVIVFERMVEPPEGLAGVHFDPPATILFGPAAGRQASGGAIGDVARLVERTLRVFHHRV